MKKNSFFLSFAALIISGLFAVNAYGLNNSETPSDQVAPQKVLPVISSSSSALPHALKAKVPNADISLYKGRKLFGGVLSSKEWDSNSFAPYGIYSFSIDETENIKFNNEITYRDYNFNSAAYARGLFYGIRPASVFGTLTKIDYFTIDPANKTQVNCFSVTEDIDYSLMASAMCYDATNNTIYATQYNEDLTGLYWSVFNPKDSSFEPIVKWRNKINALALIPTPDGKIYCIGADGYFYSINKETGIASMIGSLGVTPRLYTQSAVYDGKTNTIIWCSVNNDGNAIYAIDIATGVASKISDLPHDEQIVGLYSLDNEALPAAPAAPSDLDLVFAQPGELNGAIKFTVPTTTYSGTPLSGNVNVSIWCDGDVVRNESAAPGTSYNIPQVLSNDNHYVAVSISNNDGVAPYCNVYKYAGYDVPKAPANVSFELGTGDNEGKSIVKWDAVTEGVNNGFIDTDNLFYKVYRLPGNVLVADNLKENSFSEVLPSEMDVYSYSVVAFNGADKGSEPSYSNKQTFGNAFSVPFYEPFENEANLNLFTIVDNNNDGTTWKYNTWNKEMTMNTAVYNATSNDDWLITPRIRLEAGKKYRFTFNSRTFSTGYLEIVKVLIGSDIKDLSSFKEIADYPAMEQLDFTDNAVEFSVEKDGDYYIGIDVLSDPTQKCSILRVNSLKLDIIGALSAPDAVSDLTLTPDANDELKATLKFKTPSVDLSGSTISSLSAIKIFRNNEENPIASISNPACGVELEYTDSNVPFVGVNAYKVVAENASGLGKFNEVENFVGVYTAPYCETFDTKESFDLFTPEYAIAVDSYSGWKYESYSQSLNLFCYCVNPNTATLYTPAFKLNDESVYKLSYKIKNSTYGDHKASMTIGDAPEASSQEEIAIIAPKVEYVYHVESQEITSTKAGKKFIGFKFEGNASVSLMCNLDSITLSYVTSAKAPYSVENFSANHDENGALKANLAFKAPSKDYAGRDLSSITKIDIFRGESAIPVKTFTNPSPGESLAWTDEEPIHGDNIYIIVPSNEHGVGKALLDTIFVGNDTPVKVSDFVIKPTSDNQDATLSWSAPTIGINGGVVDKPSLTYNVLEYDPDTKTYTIVASNLNTCSYKLNRQATDKQAFYYYGIVPTTKDGTGDISLAAIMLGKLYELPYAESFANGVSQTECWNVEGNNPALDWDATDKYMGAASAQDGDNGSAYFYNGHSYGENFMGTGLSSPKICLGGNEATLSFYLYQLASGYSQNPYVTVWISANDGEPEQISDVINASNPIEWKNYQFDLSKYKDADYITIRFFAATAGAKDVVYLDNISISSPSSINDANSNDVQVVGLDGAILINGAEGKLVNVIAANGALVKSAIANASSVINIDRGIYLVRIDNKTFKVVVR